MNERKFLVAIDGSPASDAAMEIALDLAVTRGASIAFFHASGEEAERLTEADEPGSWSEDGLTYADELVRQAVASAETRGIRAAGEVFGRSPRSRAVMGVAEAIVPRRTLRRGAGHPGARGRRAWRQPARRFRGSARLSSCRCRRRAWHPAHGGHRGDRP